MWHSPHLASSTNGWMNILSFCFSSVCFTTVCQFLSTYEQIRNPNLFIVSTHNYSRDFTLNKLSVSAYEVTFANDLYIDIFTTLFYHLKHSRIFPLSIPVEYKQRHQRRIFSFRRLIHSLKTYDSTVLIYRQTKAEIVNTSCVGIFYNRSRVTHSWKRCSKRKAPSGRAVLIRTTRKDKHRKYRPISEMRNALKLNQ
jgi:hypothetical protein